MLLASGVDGDLVARGRDGLVGALAERVSHDAVARLLVDPVPVRSRTDRVPTDTEHHVIDGLGLADHGTHDLTREGVEHTQVAVDPVDELGLRATGIGHDLDLPRGVDHRDEMPVLELRRPTGQHGHALHELERAAHRPRVSRVDDLLLALDAEAQRLWACVPQAASDFANDGLHKLI